MLDSQFDQESREHELRQRLGVTIKALRRKAELSQAEMGAMCGCSKNHILRLESGNVDPSLSLFMATCRAVGEPASKVLKYLERSQVPSQRPNADFASISGHSVAS